MTKTTIYLLSAKALMLWVMLLTVLRRQLIGLPSLKLALGLGLVCYLGLGVQAQTLSEVEPNNTPLEALGTAQDRVVEPGIITGTVSGSDQDVWLIGYDLDAATASSVGTDWYFTYQDLTSSNATNLSVQRDIMYGAPSLYGGSINPFDAHLCTISTHGPTPGFGATTFANSYAVIVLSSKDGSTVNYSLNMQQITGPVGSPQCLSGSGAAFTFFDTCPVPAAPTVSVSRSNTTSLRLNSFSAVSDADGYIVQFSNNGTFTALTDTYDAAIDVTPNTVYGGSGDQIVAHLTSPGAVDVTGLTTGTNYTFKVTPYSHCRSKYVKGTAATTTPSPTCGLNPTQTVSNYSTISNDITSLTLTSFTGTSDANGYISFINTTNSFMAPADGALPTISTTYNTAGQQAIYAGASTAPNVTVTGSQLTAGNTYYIQTYGYEFCGGVYYYATTGGSTSVTVCPGTPSAPTTLSLNNISHSSVNLASISPVTDATGYVVLANTVNSFTAPTDGTTLPTANAVYGGSGEQVIYAGTSSSPNQLITGLTNANGGETYYFKSFAYTLCGLNYYFDQTGRETSVTTLGAAQTVASNAVFFEVGDTFMDFNAFIGAAGATGHVIKMNTTNSFTTPADGSSTLPTANTAYAGGEQVIFAQAGTGSGFQITGLSAATTYHFAIFTYNDIDGTIFYNQGASYTFSQQNIKPEAPITFPDFSKTYGDANFNLTASSANAGAFTYELVSQTNGGTALSGSNVTVGNVGTAVFRVNQAADANYNPSTSTATITINKAEPAIQFNALVVDFGSSDQTLTATAQPVGSAASASTGTISFSFSGVPPTGNALSGTNNSIWTPGDAGTFTITASITADANHNAGTQDALFTVAAPATSFVIFGDEIREVSSSSSTTIVDFTTDATGMGTGPFGISLINNQIWGVTWSGGINGDGTLFRVDLDGSNFMKIADFQNILATGTWPYAPTEINGKVYGVVQDAGSLGQGMIYSVDLDGTNYSIIHDFDLSSSTPKTPVGILAYHNSKLYGAFSRGGSGTGTEGGIFSLNTDGTSFTEEIALTSADTPNEGVVIHDNRVFWSTSSGISWRLLSGGSIFSLAASGNFYRPLVYNGDIYFAESSLYKSVAPYTSATVLYAMDGTDNIGSAFGPLTVEGTRFYGTAANSAGTGSVIYGVNADGTSPVVIDEAASSSYYGEVIRNVQKLTPVLTFPDQTVDHLSVSTLSATSNSTGAISYELIGDATSSGLVGDEFTAGNVGTVTIRATLAADDNFNAAMQDATFTIQKADPTFTIADLALPFAEPAYTLAPATTNYTGGTISYQFVDGGSLASTGPNTGSTISGDQLTVGNPGTETIRATLPSNANFNTATVDFQLTINDAVADLSGFTDFTVEFFQSDVTLSVPSAPGVGVSYQLLTSNTGSSLSGANNQILSVGNVLGTETIRVTVTEPNYETSTKDITLTVTKATPVLTWATPADIQFGIEPLDTDRLNATANVPGSFTYTYDDGEGVINIIPGTTVIYSIGTYTLSAEFVPTDQVNYSDAIANVTINVTKIQLEITIDDKTILLGDPEPALSYTITGGAIFTHPSAPGQNHTLFLPLTREAGSSIGTYAISVDNSQQVSQIDGNGAPVCSFGLCIYGSEPINIIGSKLNEYDITVIDGTFTIQEKVPLTSGDLTFNAPGSLVYDATAKTYTVTPNASLSPALPVGDVDLTYEGRNGTTYAVSATAPTDGGDYRVIATVNSTNANYQGSLSQDFSITPANTTIQLNLPGANPVYDGSAQGISPTANDLDANPTVGLTTEYSVSGMGSFSQTVPVDAGSYDVRVNVASSETNYTAVEATGTYTIDQATPTITFNAIPQVACGETTIDLSLYATSDVGAAVSFAGDNPVVATISGNIATIVGTGMVTITASLASTTNYTAAVDQTQVLDIAAVQETVTADNPADVLLCDGSGYTLPALAVGNYFSSPGGTGTAYNEGDQITSDLTLYVYAVGSNPSCTDENSFSVTIEDLAIDQPANVNALNSYTLPALTNGNYFTGSGGTGSALNAGDVISSNQTIYIYNTNPVSGCTREASFVVTVSNAAALHFEQVTNLTDYDYLSVPDDNSLDFTTSFTYEAWVNFDQLTESAAGYGWRSLFQKSRFTDAYGLMVYAPSKLTRFYHIGVGAGYTDYTWTGLTAGTWYHVAVKYDGANSKTSILIDGVEVASNTSQTGTLAVNTQPLLIGSGDPRGNDPYPFDGAMDEIRFWNVARTDAEILANKDLELQGTESGLVLYYNFNEGAIDGNNTALSLVPDLSAAGNDASFNRFALTGSISNYVDGSGNGVIPRQPQSITFNALSNVTFGDAGFNLSATASSGLGVTYESSDPAVATVSGSTVTIVGAGTTTITASQAGDATYLAAANVTQDLTVDPFPTSISLNLPGTDPTYSGVGQGIAPTANDTGGNPTLTLVTEYSATGTNTFSTTLPVNAGTYDVRVNLDASETNYTATEATGTFTISKAPLTVRLNDATIVYGLLGANDHPATYTGFVNGETDAVLNITTGSPTAIFVNTSTGGNYDVGGGPYMGGITWEPNPELTITSDNYAITFEAGDITSVTPRPINVTADARTITYGDDANVGNTVNFEAYNEPGQRGLANGESAADFTGTVAFNNITEVNAGSYPGAIVPNGGLTNSNYSINYVASDLTIDKAPLSVRAQSVNVEYNAGALPTITFEYRGFQNGDAVDGATDITGLAGLADGNTISATAPGIDYTAVGTSYDLVVSVGTASSTNYTFTEDVTRGQVTIVDTTVPVISLTGANPQTIEVGSAYSELGATANDNFDGDISGSMVIDATGVNTSAVGSYSVTYDVTDANGNSAVQVSRTVNVVDTTVPVITLTGADPQTIEVGSAYSELGATANDNLDGDISGSMVIDATGVNTSVVGSYSVTYDVTDANGNAAVQVSRTVNVVDTTVPLITLTGANPQTIEVGSAYTELGATANDNLDGDISGSMVINATGVNTLVLGSYSVTYDVTDANGNSAVQVSRTVNVVDTTVPVITLTGVDPQTIEVGSAYTEMGATATDNLDGDISGSIVIDATGVNTSVVGSYSVTYDVTDANGNAAVQVSRTVNVVDTMVPVITLTGADPQTIEVGSVYTELGATAIDNFDGDISGSIVIDATGVNTSVVGSYSVTYDVTDANGNAAVQVSRTVNVVDTTVPVITLTGDNPQIIIVGTSYIEQGATASDNYDGDISGSIVIDASAVDVNTVADYAVTYNVTDANGNAAIQIVRTVSVINQIAQSISFNPLTAVTFGDPTFTLSATGGASGNPVTYASSDLSVATVSGNTVTIVGAGTTNITASQVGNVTYADAADVVQSLIVNKASQTVSIATSNNHNLAEGSSVVLSATGGGSGNPVTFISTNTSIASVEADGVTLTIHQVGSVILNATQAGNDNFEAGTGGLFMTISEEYIWNGAAWNSGSLPPANKDVSFEGDYTVSGTLEVNVAILGSGVTVTIPDGAALISNTEVDSDGSSLVVESGGSLVLLGDAFGTDYTINRNTAGSGGYSIVGSPVQGATVADLGADYLYGFNGTSFTTPAGTDALTSGQGFFAGYDAASPAISLIGTPNTGNQSFNLSSSNEFHLVANPYAAPLSHSALVAGNTSFDGTIYLWDDGGSNTAGTRDGAYVTVNAAGLATGTGGLQGKDAFNGNIGTGQGFFIYADAATSIDFTPTMQSAVAGDNGDGAFYRTNEPQYIRLSLANEDYKDDLIVALLNGASNGFDAGLDARKLKNSNLSFFSKLGAHDLAIQTLSNELTEEVVIPLAYESTVSGAFTISVDELENLPSNLEIILEDSETGEQYNLSNQRQVTVTLGETSNEGRFNLILRTSEVLGTEDIKAELMVYGSPTNAKVFYSIASQEEEVMIYDLNGRVIYSNRVRFDSGTAILDVRFMEKTIYIIRIGEMMSKFSLK